MKDGRRPTSPNVMTLLGIGTTMGACVGIGAALGVVGDKAAGTSPLFVLLGVLVGIVVGAVGAYQVIRPYVRSTTDSSGPDSPKKG